MHGKHTLIWLIWMMAHTRRDMDEEPSWQNDGEWQHNPLFVVDWSSIDPALQSEAKMAAASSRVWLT